MLVKHRRRTPGWASGRAQINGGRTETGALGKEGEKEMDASVDDDLLATGELVALNGEVDALQAGQVFSWVYVQYHFMQYRTSYFLQLEIVRAYF